MESLSSVAGTVSTVEDIAIRSKLLEGRLVGQNQAAFYI